MKSTIEMGEAKVGAWNASEVFDGSFDSIYTTWSSLLLKREGWDHFLFPFLFVNADGIFHFPVYACTHSIMGTAWLYSLPFLSTSSLFLILWVQASSFTFILQLATCNLQDGYRACPHFLKLEMMVIMFLYVDPILHAFIFWPYQTTYI